MSAEHQIHYHGTTADRIDGINQEGTLPMFRKDTGLTGAWTSEILEKSLKHAIERGIERGGLEPVVIELEIPNHWVSENDDRDSVRAAGYDETVHCFRVVIPQDFFKKYIYPNRPETQQPESLVL
jgi:hypothetical protein